MKEEIQKLIGKYETLREEVIKFNRIVEEDYHNGDYETHSDYVYDDTKGTYKLSMIIEILEDLKELNK